MSGGQIHTQPHTADTVDECGEHGAGPTCFKKGDVYG